MLYESFKKEWPGVCRMSSMTIDTMAKWLAAELAPTLMGSKPSTVLSFRNHSYFPLLNLWREYGDVLLEQGPLKKVVLKETESSMIILFYHPVFLSRWLKRRPHKEFLEKRGYSVDFGMEAVLNMLHQKFQQGCPHEIGLILGIPLKDVIGFIEVRCPYFCKGQWKIYGCFENSMRIMNRFNQDREMIENWVSEGVNPCGLFSADTRKLLELRQMSA